MWCTAGKVAFMDGALPRHRLGPTMISCVGKAIWSSIADTRIRSSEPYTFNQKKSRNPHLQCPPGRIRDRNDVNRRRATKHGFRFPMLTDVRLLSGRLGFIGSDTPEVWFLGVFHRISRVGKGRRTPSSPAMLVYSASRCRLGQHSGFLKSPHRHPPKCDNRQLSKGIEW